MAPVRRRASYDDLHAVPPHQVGEFIDGELHVSPRPAKPHAAAIAALVTRCSGGAAGAAVMAGYAATTG